MGYIRLPCAAEDNSEDVYQTPFGLTSTIKVENIPVTLSFDWARSCPEPQVLGCPPLHTVYSVRLG